MCGIGGFYGSFRSEILPQMLAYLQHRGPDDEGIWYDAQARVGLVHSRLSIIDVSPLGHQPMVSHSGKSCLVFNGEIYNYQDLVPLLGEDRSLLKGHSDTEVLLYLLERHGAAILKELNGIYAFAYWNAEDRTLLLARDSFGVKPFYYASLPQGVIFGSELKALCPEATLDRSLDPRAIVSYLTFNFCPGERTMLQGVKKLEPGWALLLKEGKIVRKWAHYQVPVSTPRFSGSFQEACKDLEDRLMTGVRRQLLSDVPVGAFLSGGLDSSLLVALAAKLRDPKDLPCFTVASPAAQLAAEGFVDDLPYARIVAKSLRVPLEEIPIHEDSLNQLPMMMYQLDEPQPDLTAMNIFHLCQRARDMGIKVLIAGSGGDDIFAGYRRHTAIFMESFWSWLNPASRKGLRKLTQVFPAQTPLSRRLRRAFQFAEEPQATRLLSYYAWIEPRHLVDMLHPDILQQLGGYHPFDPLRESLSRIPDDIDPLTKMLYIEKKHFLGDHNFNYFDKMAMAHGIECRVPLLDLELIQFAESLPSRWKQHGLQGKYILRKIGEKYLPREVVYRKKTGFGPPQRAWFIEKQKDPQYRDLISPSTIQRRGIFNSVKIQSMLEATIAGKMDASYPLLAVCCIELWCRTFIDQRLPAPVVFETSLPTLFKSAIGI